MLASLLLLCELSKNTSADFWIKRRTLLKMFMEVNQFSIYCYFTLGLRCINPTLPHSYFWFCRVCFVLQLQLKWFVEKQKRRKWQIFFDKSFCQVKMENIPLYVCVCMIVRICFLFHVSKLNLFKGDLHIKSVYRCWRVLLHMWQKVALSLLWLISLINVLNSACGLKLHQLC